MYVRTTDYMHVLMWRSKTTKGFPEERQESNGDEAGLGYAPQDVQHWLPNDAVDFWASYRHSSPRAEQGKTKGGTGQSCDVTPRLTELGCRGEMASRVLGRGSRPARQVSLGGMSGTWYGYMGRGWGAWHMGLIYSGSRLATQPTLDGRAVRDGAADLQRGDNISQRAASSRQALGCGPAATEEAKAKGYDVKGTAGMQVRHTAMHAPVCA
ncbi:hypothetical protein CDD82_3309 [Ophiocordyceps australis]|uniref:Uncharacterized protein n=1 Tax=Ophiocordyceps australis TaxID=1399860 RepID=A0A2C5ZDG4_9HYPO|nr:hypothetical protein CDD82_3309 [Ophiocordyceps australis]